MIIPAIETVHVYNSETLRGVFPASRLGSAFIAWNESDSEVTFYIDQSDNGTTWTNIPVVGISTLPVHGMSVGCFYPTGDAKFFRVRLDKKVGGDSFFIQFISPSPRKGTMS